MSNSVGNGSIGVGGKRPRGRPVRFQWGREDLLERLAAENAELRDKAVNLALAIPRLRNFLKFSIGSYERDNRAVGQGAPFAGAEPSPVPRWQTAKEAWNEHWRT